MNLKPVFAPIIFLCSLSLPAQNSDTLFLSFSEFLKTVKENHPVAKQAMLLLPSADAGILAARGNFDPRLYYSIDQKQFDNKNYWTLQSGGIKIPTPIGLELNTGVERNFGSFINPENVSTANGLAFTQLSIPLLQGLLIDERRFALRNAKLFRELSLLEQKNILNELFSKASKTYWEWAQSYYNLQVIRESVQLANQRLQGMKRASLLGDYAGVDTLEASIQYQDRQVNLLQQEMDFYSKTMMLSVFLWTDKNEPVAFSAPTIPPKIADLENTDIAKTILLEMDSLANTHPNILSYQNKNARLALELRLKRDKLKPQLNVKFNPLYDVGDFNSSIFYGNSSFKWGIGLQFPVLLRKERGEIKLTKLKLADLNYEIRNKKWEITNKIKASLNEYNSMKLQAAQYNVVAQNYYQMLQAERKLFEMGESSVFMVNTREQNYINARLKLNDLRFKYRKAAVEMLYQAGQLYNMVGSNGF